MRNICFISLLLLLSFSLLSCVPTNDKSISPSNTINEASWGQSYNNLNEMYNDSFVDTVLIGKITRILTVITEPPPKAASGSLHLAFTDFEFCIERTLKGKEAGNITIHQTGASGEFEIRDDPLFQVGEQYLLFLHKYEEGRYFVTGGPQGRFKILGDKVYSMNYFLPPNTYFPPVALDTNARDLSTFIEEIKPTNNILP